MQTRAYDREAFATAWPHVLALVRDAARAGAKLVVLPEGTVPAYVLGEEPIDETQVTRATNDLAALAREFGPTIVFGSAKVVRDRTFNAAVAIGPDGRELGFAAKQFLWHFDRRWFAAGATLDPIDTPVGRLGLLVCADGRIPTIAATLVERGAEMLVMPTAWVTSGRDPRALENVQADLMASVRASENGVPFAVANKVGVERESVAYCGKSAILDAAGAFVARGSEGDESIVSGDVVLGRTPAPHAPVRTVDETSGADAVPRARIAFTNATSPGDLERLGAMAAIADADVVLSPNALHCERDAVTVVAHAGLRIGVVNDDVARRPRGLIDARTRGGVDLFAWLATDDPDDRIACARTRAAELRAYVVVFHRDGERAYAVDPDGALVAGTFGRYRLASFVYDRARTAATLVAPATDVAAGVRVAEAIRAQGFAPPRHD